ncbi:MAG TPA: lipocalin-like domain-containing protein [Chloroflexota bacterium]|nr:lipocalin-like domain-containing protein [Chloroflexota bacterium]
MPGEALRRLIGTWRLVAVEARDARGVVTHPYGAHPVGYLTYTPEGRMAVSIMRAPAPRVESTDLFRGAAEALAGGHAYVGYSGTVSVEDAQEGDAVQGTVVHTLDTCSYPNWVGTEQRRRFLLEGDELTLTTPRIERGGTGASATVRWVRYRG